MVVLVPWLVVTKDIAEIFDNIIIESDLRDVTDDLANIIKIIQPFLSDSKNYTVVSSLSGTWEEGGDC